MEWTAGRLSLQFPELVTQMQHGGTDFNWARPTQ